MRRPCTLCFKGEEDDAELKKCSGCSVATYCSTACQRQDWKHHKRYCKHLVATKAKDTPLLNAESLRADPYSSEAFGRALAAAQAADEEHLVLMTPVAAQRFAQLLLDDMLPSGPAEERLWGLWGDPRSQGYQRLLTAYQRAAKYGDLTATKLMEALCARPGTSQALTQALHTTKFWVTDQESLDTMYRIVDGFLHLVEGLTVDSEFDRWPIKSEGGGGGGADAAAAAPAAAAAGSGGGGGSGGSKKHRRSSGGGGGGA